MPAPFEGGCRCGAIRYTASAEPMMTAYCHCRYCQYASGGAASTILLVPRGSVEIQQGAPVDYALTADNGNTVTRRFCGTCGSPLFSVLDESAPFDVIKAATLDDPSWIQPAMNIWCASAQPWAEISSDLPRFDHNPG